MAGTQGPAKIPPRPGGKRPLPNRSPVRTGGPRAALSSRQLAQRRRNNLYLVSGASAVVVVILGGIIVLSITGNGGGKRAAPPTTASSLSSTNPGAPTSRSAPISGFPVAPSLQAEVVGVPASALLAAALRSSRGDVAPPKRLASSARSLPSGSKPEILYVGAEWCPFCAAERWPIVMALSKFGAFGPLLRTSSSSSDIYSNTPTFSFYRATYHSKYLDFAGVEQQTNTYVPLQAPTAAQASLVQRFDRPPYVSSSRSGSIPFIYLGGKYIVVGSQYGAGSIAGMSFDKAVPYMTSGQSATSRGAEAAAGYLVAAICQLTHGQPTSVCSHVNTELLRKLAS